jgi:hypothetical protein
MLKRISALALPLALSLFQPAARAQPAPEKFDVSPVKDAVTKLKQVPGAVQKVQGVLRAANFGPFELSGSCDFDRQWYCFGLPCQTWRWSWRFSGYEWLRGNLSGRYNDVLSAASQFDQRFSPIREWLTRTVPEFSRQLDAAATRLETAQAVLANQSASAAAKEAARKEILEAIGGLDKSLSQGTSQLQAGTASLGQFNQQLTRAIGNVEGARDVMNQTFQNDESRLDSGMSSWPCGQDDVRNKFRGTANGFRSQFESAVAAGKSFGLQSTESDRAVSTIVGTILNFHAGYTAVRDSLESASVTPAVAVQRLHLGVARSSWNDLATYARQQFGN